MCRTSFARTGRPPIKAGIAHSDDIFDHGGFAVYFFPHTLVASLADGWILDEVHPLEEGDLPAACGASPCGFRGDDSHTAADCGDLDGRMARSLVTVA